MKNSTDGQKQRDRQKADKSKFGRHPLAGKTRLSAGKAPDEAHQVRQYLYLRQRTILRYLLIYFLVSVAWIILTDWLMFFFMDNASIYQISLYKGWIFVLVSSLIFYLLLRQRHLVLDQAITRLEHSEARISREINIDQVTGLPNRRVLEQEFARRRSRDMPHIKPLGLILLDVDDMRLVNEAGGYMTGNQILRYISQLLLQLARPDDLVVHMGGDDFAILLDPAEDSSTADRFVDNISQNIRRNWQIQDLNFYLGLSIGMAVYPQHGSTFGDLLRSAETAMRRSKEQGKDSFSLYDNQMNSTGSQITGQISDLRQAISNNKFVIYFQPEYSLGDGRLRGLEVLTRMVGRNGQLISPLDFIPLAEKTGLIVPLTGLVCDMVRRQVSQWSVKKNGTADDSSQHVRPASGRQQPGQRTGAASG